MNSMNLNISARDSRHTDPRIHLFAICSQWLPLATATLGNSTVCSCVVASRAHKNGRLEEERVTPGISNRAELLKRTKIVTHPAHAALT